jgi:hypothetical protein
LLADAAWTLQQQAGWQLAGRNARGELVAELLVAEDLDDCHNQILSAKR